MNLEMNLKGRVCEVRSGVRALHLAYIHGLTGQPFV